MSNYICKNCPEGWIIASGKACPRCKKFSCFKDKRCIKCGKIFSPKKNNQSFCSQKCRSRKPKKKPKLPLLSHK